MSGQDWDTFAASHKTTTIFVLEPNQSKVNALLRELSADSEELDAPTDGPTAGIHTHAVVPKTSEPEEFEEEEEEEEEEEDRKQYPHTLPKTNMSHIKRDCL